MKSKKYVIVSRYYMYGTYSNKFVKHVDLHDSKVDVEYTYDPGEAAIFRGYSIACRYAMLLNALNYSVHVSFFINKIGSVCRPNAYAIKNKSNRYWLIFKHRDVAEAYAEYSNLKRRIYPLYGFIGEYDY